jgi:hypothetical protein
LDEAHQGDLVLREVFDSKRIVNESLSLYPFKCGEGLLMIWPSLLNRVLLVFAILFSILLGWHRPQALAFEGPVPLSSQILHLMENGGVTGAAWDDRNGNGIMDDGESFFKVVADVNFGVLLNSQEDLFYTFLPLTTKGRHP